MPVQTLNKQQVRALEAQLLQGGREAKSARETLAAQGVAFTPQELADITAGRLTLSSKLASTKKLNQTLLTSDVSKEDLSKQLWTNRTLEALHNRTDSHFNQFRLDGLSDGQWDEAVDYEFESLKYALKGLLGHPKRLHLQGDEKNPSGVQFFVTIDEFTGFDYDGNVSTRGRRFTVDIPISDGKLQIHEMKVENA
jgi:hypothetical protein